jgi:hypothetical protein
MRNLLLITLFSFSFGICFSPQTALAQETCDWEEYKNSIKETESSGTYTACNECAVGNPDNPSSCTETANGMYQFLGRSTGPGLTAYQNAQAGNPPVEPGCLTFGTPGVSSCDGQGFNRDVCAPLQEAMMDEFSMRNLQQLQDTCPAAVEAVNSGRRVTGNYRGNTLECPVTWSGILAGAHLGGATGVCNALSGGGNAADNLGTTVLGYVCQHGGLQVPETDCSPAEYDSIQVPITDGWDDTPPPPGRAGWEDPLKLYWVGGLQLMATQLTSVMMQQVHAVGKFFDVKHQLETQRLMQTKYAQAHKDYHPSEQMCEIGTFSRDLLNSEQRAKLTQTAITERMMSRGLGNGNGITSEGNTSDRNARLKQFIETFCSTEDNARNNKSLCDDTSGDADQQNIDIDYTRLIDSPLTLDIDLTAQAVDPSSPTPEEIKEEKTETNVFAFLNYIFLHDTLPITGRDKTTLEKFVIPYQDARSLMAMRSVAHHSFATLIAMKTAGPKIPPSGTGDESASPYLKALMREMGMEDDEIDDFIGINPSYYAQMEVLTKKIYQNPEFITNLYDKPTNVRRIRAAMTAIKLMQDRDIHEALMRREMLISMILELKLREKQGKLGDEVNNMVGRYSQP